MRKLSFVAASLLLACGVAFTATLPSGAAPPVTTASPTTPTPTDGGLTPTRDPRGSGIRIVGVRARTGANGAPHPYIPAPPLLYEVDVLNPTSEARTITIEQDQTGGSSESIPAGTTKTVPIARALGLLPCRDDASWYVWIRENPDAKRIVRVLPNCTFRPPVTSVAPTPTPTSLPTPGKVSYYGAKVRALPLGCNQPFWVEANVKNDTAASVSASLSLDGYPPTPVNLAPGETRTGVVTGYASFQGGDGRPTGLRLQDTTNPNNPAVVSGAFSTHVIVSCKPVFSLMP